MISIREKISAIVNDCISDIKRNSRAAGQVATGRTLKTLESEVISYGDAYTAIIWGAAYLGTLETGRGKARTAGTPEQQREFVRNLAEWCRVRGIHTDFNETQMENFARYLKGRINTSGTQLYRKGGRKDIITPAVEKMIARIDEEVAKELGAEVIEITNNFFTKR